MRRTSFEVSTLLWLLWRYRIRDVCCYAGLYRCDVNGILVSSEGDGFRGESGTDVDESSMGEVLRRLVFFHRIMSCRHLLRH